MKLINNQENLVTENATKKVFYLIGENGQRLHKSREMFKKEKKIILYPYSISLKYGLRIPRIKQLDFIGWASTNELPSDFRTSPGYGFKSQRLKQLADYLRRRFPRLKKITINKIGKTHIQSEHIQFALGDLLDVIRKLSKEKDSYSKNKKFIIEGQLSEFTTKIKTPRLSITTGDIDSFFSRFDSFENISARDVTALTKILGQLPATKISVTSHFIETREKMDIIFLEDIIEEFQSLMKSRVDNEEKWQQYFSKNSWVLTHLFPYQVILKNQKAYVGGKTFENKDGSIVDFLFETGFKDNFALLEIKTHLKPLLNSSTYRKPDVYASSFDLSGGVNQCLDQKDHFLKEFGKTEQPLDPKSILVIGQKNILNNQQIKCFELLRANQKNIDIVTFDELLAKLKGLRQVLVG